MENTVSENKILPYGTEIMAAVVLLDRLLNFVSCDKEKLKDTSRRLIERFGTVDGVLRASDKELADIEWLSDEICRAVSVARGCVSRMLIERIREGGRFSDTERIKEYCRALFRYYDVDCARVIYLNGNNGFAAQKSIMGYFGETIIDIVMDMKSRSVKKAFVVRNAPGENITRFDRELFAEDINYAKYLSRFMRSEDFCLADLVVVSGENVFSLKENGVLAPAPH